jgi:hypothetical protein
MKIKFGYLIVSFFLFVQIAFTQNQPVIDSIEKILLQTTDVQLRVELLLRLSDQYLTSAPDKAKTYAENALLLSEKNGLGQEKVHSLIDMARISQIETDLKNSISYAIQAKELRFSLREKSLSGNQRATCFNLAYFWSYEVQR